MKVIILDTQNERDMVWQRIYGEEQSNSVDRLHSMSGLTETNDDQQIRPTRRRQPEKGDADGFEAWQIITVRLDENKSDE